jgi:DNA-binding GntR family transcriptional regulator
LTEQVEDALRLDIIEGVFKPGERLRASELSERYSVSATPLREAIQRLSAQSLIDIDPRLGASVAPISEDDLQDIYWLRGILETLALERSIARGGAEWEAGVRSAFAELREATPHDGAEDISLADALRWSNAHRQFHESLFSACESPWLLRLLETLNDHSERYRMLRVAVGGSDALEEHGRVKREALSRNVPAAVDALGAHLISTVKLLTDRPST